MRHNISQIQIMHVFSTKVVPQKEVGLRLHRTINMEMGCTGMRRIFCEGPPMVSVQHYYAAVKLQRFVRERVRPPDSSQLLSKHLVQGTLLVLQVSRFRVFICLDTNYSTHCRVQ